MRYRIISVIQANSSISATPGSDRLWSVHFGQYWGISRLASSTMSWKRRSSRVGVGRGISSLLGDHVKGEDKVASVVRRPDRIGQGDQHSRGVAGVRADGHALEVDARLPPPHRLADGLDHQAERVRLDGGEQVVPDPAAELGAHHPFSWGRAQDDPQRCDDLVGAGGHGDAPVGSHAERERPAAADEVPGVAHPIITVVDPPAIVPVGAGTGSLQFMTVSPRRAAALPSMNTVVDPIRTVPWLVGGTTNATPGGVGRCGGWFIATLPTVAAGSPSTSTSVDRLCSSGPANGWGSGVGMGGLGGAGTATMCVSVPVTWSPCLAAGCPMTSLLSSA